MGDAAAKDWLQRNADDVVVEMLFGPVEEECGPTSVGGRPAVGTKAGTRLPDDVLAALWTHGPRPRAPDRAQMIRSLVTAGLQPARPTSTPRRQHETPGDARGLSAH